MNRRNFLKTVAAGASAAWPLSGETEHAPEIPARTSMGVVQYSFSPSPQTRSAYAFLEYSASLGAGGVQAELDSLLPDYTERVRRRAEELGMYLEVIVSLPKQDRRDDFEQVVPAAKRAGAVCLRAACLSGRRYETFSSLKEWRRFVADSRARLSLAVPVLEKHRVPLGLENHKDWTAGELVTLMKEYSSEFLGVCLDTGNNLALLDDPVEVVEALAPYAVTTHIKDMAVQEYEEGLLLSEVPLGEGILDLPRVLATIRRFRPRTRFSLEMITRDPLKIPCLAEKYWATFPERRGKFLPRALSFVRSHPPSRPLSKVSSLPPDRRYKLEEDNVRRCLAYAREHLGLK